MSRVPTWSASLRATCSHVSVFPPLWLGHASPSSCSKHASMQGPLPWTLRTHLIRTLQKILPMKCWPAKMRARSSQQQQQEGGKKKRCSVTWVPADELCVRDETWQSEKSCAESPARCVGRSGRGGGGGGGVQWPRKYALLPCAHVLSRAVTAENDEFKGTPLNWSSRRDLAKNSIWPR